MLSPEYLLRVSEGGEAIAETLHNEIIKSIVSRIAARLDRGDSYILTARDKWQIEVLQEAGFLREDIERTLVKYTGLMQKEIAEAMEEAGVTALDYDDEIYKASGLSPAPLTQSPHLIRIMQQVYEMTAHEWVNYTRTTADACQQNFIRSCDKAYTMVGSGASSYSQAFIEAINETIDHGVEVTYSTGHTDTLETATLRCIRTGVSQATARITDARMDEMDWDIVLVSSHLGARVTDREDFTNHYWWQGKFYSRTGRDARFPPFSVCGMGHVQGIHGANCRHSHGPGDGEFNPFEHYDSEENRKEYELQQRQRTLERRIRESKRKCIGLKQGVDSASTPEGKAELQAEYERQAALLQKRNAAYNQFCEENNLKKLNERITIAKWDRKQAAKARAAAKRSEKSVAISGSSDTIKEKVGIQFFANKSIQKQSNGCNNRRIKAPCSNARCFFYAQYFAKRQAEAMRIYQTAVRWAMQICGFTKTEADYLEAVCNFTPDEERLFRLRLKGDISLEECAEQMNRSVDSVKKISRRVNEKIRREL